MKKALYLLSSKKLGFLIVIDKKITKGIITDGELRRFNLKNKFMVFSLKIMTKNPISIDK